MRQVREPVDAANKPVIRQKFSSWTAWSWWWRKVCYVPSPKKRCSVAPGRVPCAPSSKRWCWMYEVSFNPQIKRVVITEETVTQRKEPKNAYHRW